VGDFLFDIQHRTYPMGRFWERTLPHASAQSQKRFIAAFEEYLESMVQEAIDRSERRIRDIQSYIDIRRATVGAKPALALIELDMNIPDEVVSHPAIQVMESATSDMISASNVSDFSVNVNDK
jgi:hypothetical protein